MVIAHHLMWTLYGWWLPNDLRGSTSTVIRHDLLRELGELHLSRKKLQPASRDIRAFYAQAAAMLKHALLGFAPGQFAAVTGAIEAAIRTCGYTCYGLAIMPDHVHLIIRKHRDWAEEMIVNIQTASRNQLIEVGLRDAGHPVWTRGGWKVFLNTPDDVWRTIRYIENNPLKVGLPVQHWPCVVPYDNWPCQKTMQVR